MATQGVEAEVGSSGQGGDINIAVGEHIFLDDNGEITTNTTGDGDGGSINITAQSLELDGDSEVEAEVYSSGRGGDINIIVSEHIFLNDDSEISSITEGSGNGGNINVTAQSLELDGDSGSKLKSVLADKEAILISQSANISFLMITVRSQRIQREMVMAAVSISLLNPWSSIATQRLKLKSILVDEVVILIS